MGQTIIVCCCLCAVGILAAASLVISYQHEKIRQKIVERAKGKGCFEVKKLEDALDDMLGSAIRSFCAANDEDFQKKLDEIMSE